MRSFGPLAAILPVEVDTHTHVRTRCKPKMRMEREKGAHLCIYVTEVGPLRRYVARRTIIDLGTTINQNMLVDIYIQRISQTRIILFSSRKREDGGSW